MKYYHGTVEADLGEIEVGYSGGIHRYESAAGYAYATTSESSAWYYAELAWNNTSNDEDVPRVYIVEPNGVVEKDPGPDALSDDYRCADGWVVVGELPTPEHWLGD